MKGKIKGALKKIWNKCFDSSPYFLLIKLLPNSYLEKVRSNLLMHKTEVYEKGTWLENIVFTELDKEIEKTYYSNIGTQIRLTRVALWGSKAGKKWHEQASRRYSDPSLYESQFVARRTPCVLNL